MSGNLKLETRIDKGEVTRLCADAISELERAARLHPKWPTELHYHDEEQQEGDLTITRALNDHGRATGTSIFIEEWLEFLLATRKPGNQVAARAELVQAMAMLLRVYCHLNDYMKHGGTESTEKKQTFVAPPVDVKEFCNTSLRSAMLSVVEAFDKLSLERKGESCIYGCACLRHNLNQKEEVQMAAVDEAYKGIGAPGDWGYNSEQGTQWYQLLLLCGEIDKRRKAVQP